MFGRKSARVRFSTTRVTVVEWANDSFFTPKHTHRTFAFARLSDSNTPGSFYAVPAISLAKSQWASVWGKGEETAAAKKHIPQSVSGGG